MRETRKDLVWAARIYSSEYHETGYGPSTAWFGNNQPKHYIDELNFSVGKVRYLTKDIGFSLTGGPSYVHYEMPINIKRVSSGGWGGIITSTTFEHDVRKYYLLGLSARGEMIIGPWNSVGFTVGGEYHYSRKVRWGGMSINLMLGRFRPKKPE